MLKLKYEDVEIHLSNSFFEKKTINDIIMNIHNRRKNKSMKYLEKILEKFENI